LHGGAIEYGWRRHRGDNLPHCAPGAEGLLAGPQRRGRQASTAGAAAMC